MVQVLDPGQFTVSLLDAGRATKPPGAPGLSNRARQATQQFLQQSAAGANQLFSSTTSASLTTDQLQQQILAIRARMSPGQLATNLQPATDDGTASESSLGQNVDRSA
jgi:hypothetical protein